MYPYGVIDMAKGMNWAVLGLDNQAVFELELPTEVPYGS